MGPKHSVIKGLDCIGDVMSKSVNDISYQVIHKAGWSDTLMLKHIHGWASAELPRNRVNVNLFLCHIRDLSP